MLPLETFEWIILSRDFACVCQCFEEAGGEWRLLSKCVAGSEGKQLQLEAERITNEIAKPKLKNVPTVVFNHVRFICIFFILSGHN